jgi:hypothetical protein
MAELSKEGISNDALIASEREKPAHALKFLISFFGLNF